MNNKNFLQKLFLINSELQETSNNSFNTNYLIISVAFFCSPSGEMTRLRVLIISRLIFNHRVTSESFLSNHSHLYFFLPSVPKLHNITLQEINRIAC